MSTFGSNPSRRGCVGNSRRIRVPLNFDLNSLPLNDIWAPEATAPEASTSARGGLRGEQVSRRNRGLPHAGGIQRVVPIDVEAIDDVIVLSSPRSVREGRNHSQPNHVAMIVLDDDSDVYQGRSGAIISEEPVTTRLSLDIRDIYGRNPFNWEHYINLEDSFTTQGRIATKSEPQSTASKEPIFSCAVCMGPLVKETSTICGHIFCKECISMAIKAQKKCPTCRRKLTRNNIHRVYLPTAC